MFVHWCRGLWWCALRRGRLQSFKHVFIDRQLRSVADLGVARKTLESKVAELGVMRAFVLPMFDRIAGNHIVLFHIFVKLSRLYDSHCGQLVQTRVPRKFETAVGAVIRVVLSTMFHRWKATDVVHVRMFGYSAEAIFAWSS